MILKNFMCYHCGTKQNWKQVGEDFISNHICFEDNKFEDILLTAEQFNFYKAYPEFISPAIQVNHDAKNGPKIIGPISQILYKIYMMRASNLPLTKSMIYETILTKTEGLIEEDKKNAMQENRNIRKAFNKLVSEKYLTVANETYSISWDGEMFLNSCMQDQTYYPDTSAFKREALTGTDKNGRETKLINAAIPKPQKIYHTSDADESLIDIQRSIRELSHRFGRTIYEITCLVADEKIKRCPACHNISIFHTDNSKTDGLKTYCIDCCKDKRN